MKNKIPNLDTEKVSGRYPNRNVIDIHFDCPIITKDMIEIIIPKMDESMLDYNQIIYGTSAMYKKEL